MAEIIRANGKRHIRQLSSKRNSYLNKRVARHMLCNDAGGYGENSAESKEGTRATQLRLARLHVLKVGVSVARCKHINDAQRNIEAKAAKN